MVFKAHLSRRIVCVAYPRTPGGEVEEFEVPKVWSSDETVLAPWRGQLARAGGGAVTPVAVDGPQVVLHFQKLILVEQSLLTLILVKHHGVTSSRLVQELNVSSSLLFCIFFSIILISIMITNRMYFFFLLMLPLAELLIPLYTKGKEQGRP